jgi:hypothetical protein
MILFEKRYLLYIKTEYKSKIKMMRKQFSIENMAAFILIASDPEQNI